MQFTSLKSKLAVALPLAAVAILGTSNLVIAQPAVGGAKRGGRKAGLPKKQLAKIEAALGKPLTDDQKKQLGDAAKERRDAVKAATDKFNDEVAKVTGLTLDQVKELSKPANAKKDN